MVNFTLFEVHLDDGNLQIGPSGIDFVPDEESDADADEGVEVDAADEEADGEEDSGGIGVLGLLLLLGVLAGVAFAAKKFLGNSDEGFEELEELDDLSEKA
jgi:hypothetical protein